MKNTTIQIIVLSIIALVLIGFGIQKIAYEPKIDLNEVGAIKKEHKLKAPKDKILDHREKIIYHRELVLGSDKATSTNIEIPQYNLIPETIIEYDYISDVITDSIPYYDKESDSFSGAEYLESRDDSKTPIAFYSEDLWFKDNDEVIYEIVKDATTTVEAFEEQTKLTLLEKINRFFIGEALAIDTYNSSGTYTPTESGAIEILVIGGGGGGGQRVAGGGGAGGYQYDASFAVTAQEYTVTVGTGGAGGASNSSGNPGVRGATSTFDTIDAIGGGGGGIFFSQPDGGDGGSGGGAGCIEAQTSSGVPGTGSQGFDGGEGGPNATGGGGGGGASEVGADNASPVGGDGGDGLSNSISGSAVTYAGGGGGSGSSTRGSGGAGGGGDGTINGEGSASAGTDNLGGGGGGARNSADEGGIAGGDGGDGIIIIVFTGPLVSPEGQLQIKSGRFQVQ